MDSYQVAAISGTRRGMTNQQEVALCDILDELKALSDVRHGDCKGVDARAHDLVRDRCESVTMHVYPPTNEKDRAFCGSSDGPTVVFHEAMSFLKRDRSMIDASDVLIAFPDSRTERLRSGTWSAVRHARRTGKPLILVFPTGCTSRENMHYDDEESLESYGYDPECQPWHSSVKEALAAKGALCYADIAPARHTIVINEHVLVKFKLFNKYQTDGNRYRTLIITHAATVKRLRRTGLFTSTLNELVGLLAPQYVVIESVLADGGMPEWCSKNGFWDEYGTESWVKRIEQVEVQTGA